MVKTSKLVQFCDELLSSFEIVDYCPNGLQIQGVKKVKTIASGVTASLDVVTKAVKMDADVLLVHHGYFWKNEPATITKLKYQRIKLLMDNNINLVAYHLPLDIHDVVGNNAQLAKVLQVSNARCIQDGKAKGLFWFGKLDSENSLDELVSLLTLKLGREPLVIKGHDRSIRRLSWCTGAAQDMIRYAIDRGLDAFISGEVSEHIFHLAKEAGIVYIAAGHHATERYGVQALGKMLADEFNIVHSFIDQSNPI